MRKKTGKSPDGNNYAGEFVFVGVGQQIQSWLNWSEDIHAIEISSLKIPQEILPFLRNDEGALFSVIDYCDVLSIVLFGKPNTVLCVQNPMKWQPNEIDGFYFAKIENKKLLIPIEAKALVTGDDINLEQMLGALITVSNRYSEFDVGILPIAIQMIKNGLRIAVFKVCDPKNEIIKLELDTSYKVIFTPEIKAWL